MSQLELEGGECIEELRLALKAAATATRYLASAVRDMATDYRLIAGSKSAKVLSLSLRNLYDAMETIGDFLNRHDALEDGDAEAVDTAFEMVRRVMKKHGIKPMPFHADTLGYDEAVLAEREKGKGET